MKKHIKMKTARGLLIFLAICLVLTYACSKKAEDTGWSANIEIVDGMKVVTNPGEPKFGVFVFDLEEDLAIGNALSKKPEQPSLTYWILCSLGSIRESMTEAFHPGNGWATTTRLIWREMSETSSMLETCHLCVQRLPFILGLSCKLLKL